MGLAGRVIETIPCAVYQGTAYTQTMVLEVDGITFGVFDTFVHSVKESPTVDVVRLSLFNPEVVGHDPTEFGVESGSKVESWDNTFAGEIVALGDARVLLGVGAGTVAFDRADIDGVAVGDRLEIRAHRTELCAFEPAPRRSDSE